MFPFNKSVLKLSIKFPSCLNLTRETIFVHGGHVPRLIDVDTEMVRI